MSVLSIAMAGALPGGSAAAQRMDLSLSRLRVEASDAPGASCPRNFTPAGSSGVTSRDFCSDDDAWRRLGTQFAGSMIPPVLLPAHTRGMRGIHVALETVLTGIDSSSEYWARGTEGDDATVDRNRFVDQVLAWNRLSARKGLPFGFEIGTNFGFLANTSYWTMGVEVRWALLEGLRPEGSSFDYPSLSVRGSVQTLLGEGEMNATVPALDVSIGERIVVGDTVEISPYLGAQLAWLFVDTELVDLTPGTDAFAACNPDPYAPGDPRHTGGGEPPYCRGNPIDFNHSVVFPSLRSLRARMFVGAQVRYEWFAFTAAFVFDPATPSDLDSSLPSDLPRQWQLDMGVGVSY